MLAVGVGFHAAIGVCLGQTSFSLAMSAGLILYLRAPDAPFRLLARLAPRVTSPPACVVLPDAKPMAQEG